MLEVWTKFISAVMLSLYGFYAIKKLTKSEVKLLNVKSILYLLTLCIVTVYFHKIKLKKKTLCLSFTEMLLLLIVGVIAS